METISKLEQSMTSSLIIGKKIKEITFKILSE